MRWIGWLDTAFVKGVLGALVGGTALYIGLHIWIDHQALHAVVDCINKKCWEGLPVPLTKPAVPPSAAAPAHP